MVKFLARWPHASSVRGIRAIRKALPPNQNAFFRGLLHGPLCARIFRPRTIRLSEITGVYMQT